MNSVEVREAVLRAILEHEQGDFQSFQIREELGWSEESPEARRLHAIIQSLKHEGVITQTGTKRKRNQYLKLRHPDELRRRLRIPASPAAKNGGAAPAAPAATPGPQRVRYLEERVSELESRAGADPDVLRSIMEALGEIKAKVDAIHREWVSSD
jgi:hypothetical protein